MKAEEIEHIAFEIVAEAGDSFSYTMEAMNLARTNLFEEAQVKLVAADEALLIAHKSHSQLLFNFANGDKIEPTILLVHAQDHLMKAELALVFARENLALHQAINANNRFRN